MGRKPNPDKVSRADLITRTIEFHTFRVKILPEGADTVSYMNKNGIGTVDKARRNVMKDCRKYGVVIDIEHTETRSGLYGMTPEKFIECGELLVAKESNKESEDIQ